MKRFFCACLAVVLSVCAVQAVAFAEPVNTQKAAWTGNRFAGTIAESEEDGIQVYTYTPKTAYHWFSPTISVRQAILDALGDKEEGEVVLSVEMRGVFRQAGGTLNTKAMLRAVNPASNDFSFTDKNNENWLEELNEAYLEACDNEPLLKMYSSNGNVMCTLDPNPIEFGDETWTKWESDPIYITKKTLTSGIFADLVFCFDSIDYSAEGVKSIQVRSMEVYNYDDWAAAQPTPTPTEEPTPTETPTTVPTDEPEGTTAPAETPVPTEEAEKSDYTILFVSIICGVLIIAAIVALLIVRRKQNKQEK